MLIAWNRDHFDSVLKKTKKIKDLLWKVEEALTRTGDVEMVN